MKNVVFMLSLLGIMLGLAACSGSEDCPDGSTPAADGSCPSGDDDAT
jgi:hypothetical protein